MARRLNDKLEELQPDLAVITETHASVNFDDSYFSLWSEPSPRKNLPGEAVASLFSRWPLIPVPTYDPTEAVAALVQHPTLPLILYGSIIVYFGYRGPDGNSPPKHEQRKAIQKHGADWAAIRKTYPSHELITAGDYNVRLNPSSRKVVEKQLLQGQIDAAGLNVLTNDNFGVLAARPTGTIDHICVTNGLTKAAVAIDWFDRTLSDHNLIVVDIEV